MSTDAGVIDFYQADARLILSRVSLALEANEERDEYLSIGIHRYAINAMAAPEKSRKGKLDVLLSQLNTPKGETTPELLGMGVFRLEDERIIYSPFLDDDALLAPEAMALTHSIERLLLGEVCERE